VARYVIDAPTLLHLADTGLHVHPGHQLVGPSWIRSEALELLLGDVCTGKRTEAAALEAHERITGIKMRLLGDRASRRAAWQIAREHDWKVLRDAEYLAVTRLQADALVTVDPGLAAAARDVVRVAAIDALLAPGLLSSTGSPARAELRSEPRRGPNYLARGSGEQECHDER